MSAPSPAATSVRHLLKIWSNGCSTTLIVRSGLAARTASSTVFRAPVSPPPEPYECHRVTSPVRPAGASDGAASLASAEAASLGAALGDGLAALLVQAAATMTRPDSNVANLRCRFMLA